MIAGLGALALVIGVLQMLKAKKIGAVPFRKPAEIAVAGAGAANAEGLISTEGQVVPVQTLVAPMSGQPCVSYEIRVDRKFERASQGQKGRQGLRGQAGDVVRDHRRNRQRQTAERTIANQIASLFRKLGINARREVATRLAQLS